MWLAIRRWWFRFCFPGTCRLCGANIDSRNQFCGPCWDKEYTKYHAKIEAKRKELWP